ncbi:hypothetical protein BJX99DRAFT_260928 [Aspergillus californicus]
MLRQGRYEPVHPNRQDDESLDSSDPIALQSRSQSGFAANDASEPAEGDKLSPIQPVPVLRSLKPSPARWLTIAITLLAITPFIAIEVAALWLRDKPIKLSVWHGVDIAIGVTATLFPITFAAIIGRLMQQVAQLKLERSARLLLLEQLIGSTTFFGAISTQWTLGAINIVGLGMCVLWLLSPLGAQAALRVLSTEYKPQSTTVNVAYLDINAYSQSTDLSLFAATNLPADKTFLVSMSAANTTASSPTENPKLFAGDSESNKRIYPSVIGIPVFHAGTGNTSLTVESSYYDIACFNLRNISGEPTNITGYYSYQYLYFQNHDNSTERPGSNQNSTFAFASTNYDGSSNAEITAADCSVRQKFVEAVVTCFKSVNSQPRCSVIGVSPSKRYDTNDSSSPPTLFSNPDMFRVFRDSFMNASPIGHAASPGLVDNYLVDPSNPVREDWSLQRYVSSLSEDILSERLMQLINSFYIARLGSQALINRDNPGSVRVQNISGVNIQVRTDLTCTVDWRWFTVLLLATLAMVVASIAAFLIASCTTSPDILGYVSTLTRENPSIPLPGFSSTLGGLERATLQRDILIRLGDVKPDDDGVGEMGIGLLTTTAKSSARRYYR